MVGESHQKEKANLQWDRLDMEGHSLINKILTAETKKVEWPDNAEPKFTKKRTAKAIRMAYNSKTKRYIHNDTSTLAPSKPIRLELSEAFFHFCYYPERKEYIKIDTPPGRERGRCQICYNSIQLPLDLQKKHYSHCTSCICNPESASSRQ